MTTFDAWWGNFQGDDERYFGACLLDALVFRSEDQTVALARHLFQRTLADAARRLKLGDAPQWLERLQSRGYDQQVRLVPVLHPEDSPTKSGATLTRMFRRELGIKDESFVWPADLEVAYSQGARVFIFVDDFLGTGRQFRKFAEAYGIGAIIPDATLIYCPLAAHRRGLLHLANRVPRVHVSPVEILETGARLFHESAPWFDDGVNNAASALQFYKSLLSRHGFDIAKARHQGYGRLGLAYCFNHAVPNNCLPIFWQRTESWHPLHPR